MYLTTRYLLEYDTLTDDYLIWGVDADGLYTDEPVYVDPEVFNKIEQIYLKGNSDEV